MDLGEPLVDPKKTVAELNNQLPEELNILQIKLHSGKFPQNIITSYKTTFLSPLTSEEKSEVSSFFEKGEVLVTRQRKGRKQEINIRPLITKIQRVGERSLNWSIINKAGAPTVKVIEAISVLFPARIQELLDIAILKTEWQPYENE